MTDESPSTKSTDITIPADATAGEAFQVAMDACLEHLAPNEACWLSTEHPDCLHQTRVSTRRLRALFSLMRELVRDDPVLLDIKARLRLILVPLGPARDLDVALQRAEDNDWSAADLTASPTPGRARMRGPGRSSRAWPGSRSGPTCRRGGMHRAGSTTSPTSATARLAG